MHDESPEHAGHLLHSHVRVIEVCALLLDDKVVGEALTRLDWGLADTRHAVATNLVLEAVPVERARLW